jgi:hypothetical protein
MTFSFMVLEPTIKLSWSDVHPRFYQSTKVPEYM